MASKNAKCDLKGVKITIFLLQNRSAAGGYAPRPLYTVIKYLVTIPVCDTLKLHQLVQHGG